MSPTDPTRLPLDRMAALLSGHDLWSTKPVDEAHPVKGQRLYEPGRLVQHIVRPHRSCRTSATSNLRLSKRELFTLLAEALSAHCKGCNAHTIPI